MNLPAPGTFTLPAPIRLDKLNAELKAFGMTLSGNMAEACDAIVLDTFDAAVFNSDGLLVQTATDLTVIRFKDAPLVQNAPEKPWKFASDLSAGDIKTWLTQLSPLRSFMPAGQVLMTRDTLRLLDDEEKTCCRVEVISLGRKNKAWTWMRTQPMRGYDDCHDLVCSVLSKVAEKSNPARLMKLKISDYTSKPKIQLSEKASIKTSLCTVVQTFLKVTRKNEPGLIDDIDTEFLHQWRVSLRKVRSVLALFKGVVADETLKGLQLDFKEIMQDTNLMRDRDVYLLARKDYFALIPPKAHPGLEILFDLLEKERNQSLEKVRVMLKSKAYKRRMTSMQKLFEDPKELPSGPKADLASKPFAATLVLKRYNKVCHLAQTISKDTPDETIHELRIQCKKLRYLIESAQPLFDAAKIKALLKTLKGLQEHLGSFNDQSVQQATLAQCLEQYSEKGKKARALAESIGALTAMLYRRQLAERKLIIDSLSMFYSPATQDAFNALFQLEKKPTRKPTRKSTRTTWVKAKGKKGCPTDLKEK